jgi:2-aminoadipate transaminase
MDYENLFARTLIKPTEMPVGMAANTKYVFSVTYTDSGTLPYQGLSDALSEAMHREGRDLAMYPPPQGHEGMRELIAETLAENREVKTSPDSIFLSAGASGGIQCILDVFIEPGDIVLVEEFTYMGSLAMLLQRGAEVIHVPTDQDGMDTDVLEDIVRDLVFNGKRPKMIFTIPLYQNPMGMNLSLERRKRMLKVSQEYGIPILENESYADFQIDGDPLPPAMLGMDESQSVMYVSSYTKLLGCGLRLGYAVVPDVVRDTLAAIQFGGLPSHLAAMAVHGYLRSYRKQHVQAPAAALGAKRDAMLEALREHFPPICTWNRPQGGMMIWVRLPEGADTGSVLDKAVEADVKYNPGSVFRADRGHSNYIRLTYSHNTPQEIREGIAILADVFNRQGLFES